MIPCFADRYSKEESFHNIMPTTVVMNGISIVDPNKIDQIDSSIGVNANEINELGNTVADLTASVDVLSSSLDEVSGQQAQDASALSRQLTGTESALSTQSASETNQILSALSTVIENQNIQGQIDEIKETKVNASSVATINGQSILNGGNIVISGGDSVDLSGYDTADQVDAKIAAAVADVSVDLSGYAQTSDLENLATTQSVSNLNDAINNVSSNLSSNYSTSVQTSSAISDAINEFETGTTQMMFANLDSSTMSVYEFYHSNPLPMDSYPCVSFEFKEDKGYTEQTSCAVFVDGHYEGGGFDMHNTISIAAQDMSIDDASLAEKPIHVYVGGQIGSGEELVVWDGTQYVEPGDEFLIDPSEYDIIWQKQYIKTNSVMREDDVNAKVQEAKDEVAVLRTQVAGIAQFRTEIVNQLPQVGEYGVIYMVPKALEEQTEDDLYNEYLWNGSTFDFIGAPSIDLSDYAKTEDLAGFQTASDVNTAISTAMSSALKMWRGTQAQYDAILVKDPDTLYIVSD